MVLPPAGTFSLKAENAELEPLIGALTGVRALAGTGNLTRASSAPRGRRRKSWWHAQGHGAAFRSAAAGLPDTDLGGMVSAVRERILDGWTAVPGGTPLDNAERQRDACRWPRHHRPRPRLATPGLQLSLSGTADLLRRALDIKAEFLPPETAPLPVPVIIQGNWAAPRIYPDIPDILNNPEGGFARLRTVETPHRQLKPGQVRASSQP